MGKNDDLEDSKSISDDTDVEVTSEVGVSSKRAVLHPPRLPVCTFQHCTCVEEGHFPHFYLPFLDVKTCWLLYILLQVFIGIWRKGDLSACLYAFLPADEILWT